MKLSLHWRSLLEGAGPAGRAALKEFENAYSVLTQWTAREHDNDGKHTNVTAQTVLLERARAAALKIVNGWMDVGAGAAYSGAITPPEMNDPTTEDYCPTGIEDAFLLRLSASVPVAIGGIKDGPRLIPIGGRVLALPRRRPGR